MYEKLRNRRVTHLLMAPCGQRNDGLRGQSTFFSAEYQYSKPNVHNGMRLWWPISVLSTTKKRLSKIAFDARKRLSKIVFREIRTQKNDAASAASFFYQSIKSITCSAVPRYGSQTRSGPRPSAYCWPTVPNRQVV